MLSVAVGNKTMSLPILVPSISSFETQLEPVPALQLQQALREPVSLISAYDLKNGQSKNGKNPLLDLCRDYRNSGVLLLDSGGYEHSRIERYARGKAPLWTFADFKSVCDLGVHDFAFSYDYFWRDDPNQNESIGDFELRLLGELFSEHHFVSAEKLIPVLHLQTRQGDERLSQAQVLSLVDRVASECKSPFIAIAERELGDGLLERFHLARAVCKQIEQSNKSVSLHVLGCGNPLTFAFMCVAGAKMADGLEWYRTFAAENFHLHHFQQEPLFDSACDGTYNPTASLILSLDVSYGVKVATRNLMSFQTFMTSLAKHLPDRSVYQLVSKQFGKRAGSALQAVET